MPSIVGSFERNDAPPDLCSMTRSSDRVLHAKVTDATPPRDFEENEDHQVDQIVANKAGHFDVFSDVKPDVDCHPLSHVAAVVKHLSVRLVLALTDSMENRAFSCVQ